MITTAMSVDMRRLRTPVVIRATASLLLLAPISASLAQGSLSTQGLGYPVGAFSIRSNGTGGSFGEFDALTPLNPSSIAGVQRMAATVQTEPEYRTLKLGGLSEKNTVQRIPLILMLFPAPRNFAIAISASSFLDRTYSTLTTGQANLGDETVTTTDAFNVRGSMSDLRLGVGYKVNEKLRVGIGGHLFVGSNTVSVSREFADTSRFGTVSDSSVVQFQGTALSVGGDYMVTKHVGLSASYRKGNSIEATERDVVEARANVPSRIGAGLRYEGIPGSVFAFSVEQVQWSAIAGLGSTALDVKDATNWSAGAEVAGPHLRQLPVQIRAGYAQAQLPFGVSGRAVSEKRLAAGVGIPVAQENASIDLSLQRAWRSLSGSAAREGAWRLGIGIQIRP